MIFACLKWVDRRPEVDPLDGHVTTNPRTACMSVADATALEWALRCGERWDRPVGVVTVGPADARTVLRDGMACGATRAVHVHAAQSPPSASVAAALASVLTELGATTVWCGDYSLDRGSGSVPAYLAAELGFAQALGLVDITIGAGHDIVALRRLDGGRREELRVRDGAVLPASSCPTGCNGNTPRSWRT